MAENLADGKVSISADLSALNAFARRVKQELKNLEKGTYDVKLQADDKVTGEVKKVTRKVDEFGRKKAKPKLEADDKTAGPLAKVGSALKKLHSQRARPTVAVDDQASPSIDRISGSLKKLVGGAAIVAGIYAVGRAVKFLGGEMIGGAADMESYRLTLETVMGSTQAAGEMMDWVVKFAAKTPFEIPGLMEAAVRLQAYGIDAREVMETLGNTASAMGKDVMEAVEALADAQTGEFERLKEFGVKAVEIGKAQLATYALSADNMGKTMLMYTDSNGKEAYKIVDRNNRAMITSNLLAIWNERYAGAMEKQSHSWKGMISNLKDSITMGLTRAGEAILPKLKPYLQKVLDYVSSDEFANAFSRIADGIVAAVPRIAAFIGDIITLAKSLWDAFSGPAFTVAKAALGLFSGAVKLIADNMNIVKPVVIGFIAAFAGYKIIQTITGWIGGLSGVLPKLAGIFSGAGGAAARAAGDYSSLGNATGSAAKSTTGFIGSMLPLAGVAIGAGTAIWSAWSAHKAHEAQVKADTLAAASMTGELDNLRNKTAECKVGTDEYTAALEAQATKAKEITDKVNGLGAVYDETGRQIDANTQLINMLASNYDTGNAKLDKYNLSLMQNKATMSEGLAAYNSTLTAQEKTKKVYDDLVLKIAKYRESGKAIPLELRSMFEDAQRQYDQSAKNVASSLQGMQASVDAFGQKIAGPGGLSAMTGKDLQAMLGMMKSTTPQVHALGLNMMQQIVNAEAAKNPVIAANAQTIMDNIKLKIEQLPAGERTAAKMQEIITQEITAYGPITGEMQGIMDGLKGVVGGTDLSPYGWAMTMSLRDGISSASGYVVQAALNLSNRLRDVFANTPTGPGGSGNPTRHGGGPIFYPGTYDLLEEEYVMQQSAVRKFGLNFMMQVNAGHLPGGGAQDNRTIHIHNPVFPNVRTGKDADDLMRQVDRKAGEAAHLRRVLPST